jgi:type III secretory pathway component EscU
LPDVVGLVDIPQQTPFAVTVDPPSDEIVPPLVAVVIVILVIAVVVTTGMVIAADVVNCTSDP